MRRNAALATAAAIAAMLALGGCSLFGSGDDKEAAAAAQVEAAALYVPVEAVRFIEIGRTRNGYVITAHGEAPGLGHGAPELRAGSSTTTSSPRPRIRASTWAKTPCRRAWSGPTCM